MTNPMTDREKAEGPAMTLPGEEKLKAAGLAAVKARTMPEWISPQWRAGWAAHHAREIETVEGYLNSLNVGLIEQAASQLLSIAQNAPAQGSLHHVAMIHADALMGIAEALSNRRPSVSGEGALADAAIEVRDALDFFDRVKAASADEQIAVGTDHWDRLEAAARRVAAALSTPTEGMVMVPREPTEGMVRAAWALSGESEQMYPRFAAKAKRHYAAMIQAASEEK